MSTNCRRDSIQTNGREIGRRRHRIFCFVRRGTEAGKKVRPQIRKASRRHKARRGFSTDSLVQLFYRWDANGRTVDSVCPAYAPGRPVVPEKFLLRFLRHACSELRPLSLRATFKAFAATLRAPAPASYSTVARYLPSATYRKIQRELRAIAACKVNADRLQAEAAAAISAHFREASR